MTDQEKLLSIMPPLARLNAWARLEYKDQLDMHEMPSRIYAWKKMAIGAAMKLGMATQRIIGVERSCKACKGTGEYKWVDWNDEDHVDYQDCRRCGATGKVILRFVESTIAGQYRFHTPRPRWDLGVFTPEDFEAVQPGGTDWEPEQPGAPLERLEFIRLINQVEAIIPVPEPRFGSSTEYSLHLGELPGCWICGSINCRYSWDLYRMQIGLRWKAGLCEACEQTDTWAFVEPTWPVSLHAIRNERDSFPRWHDRPPLPPMANDPAVLEWLARRQIYPGCYPPGDYAYTASGDFVRVKSATATDAVVGVVDRHGWTGTWDGRPVREYIGWLNEAVLTLPQSSLRGTARNPYVTEFDWSEVCA
jgi:Zn ribbon nucleic-acid-binding protein